MDQLSFFLFLGLIAYYMLFLAAFIEGDISTKKQFWLGLIPFGEIIAVLWSMYKNLK